VRWHVLPRDQTGAAPVNSIVYLVGLIVIVLAILSFVGVR
jgi:hypothetical protein